jgi:hypothetical protein
MEPMLVAAADRQDGVSTEPKTVSELTSSSSSTAKRQGVKSEMLECKKKSMQARSSRTLSADCQCGAARKSGTKMGAEG